MFATASQKIEPPISQMDIWNGRPSFNHEQDLKDLLPQNIDSDSGGAISNLN
jgi:hypothetical protein